MNPAQEAAEHLAEHGAALFTAPFVGWGKGSGGCGYALPSGWQQTTPAQSSAALRQYRKGHALCLVGGYAVDIIDFDPRNGSEPAREAFRANGWDRCAVGVASTPSGGEHLLIPATGKHKSVPWIGVDHQAGVGGQGAGFAFIAPTVKQSKVDGAVKGYEWVVEPNLEELDTASLEYEGLLAEIESRSTTVYEADTVEFEGLPDYEVFDTRHRERIDSYVSTMMDGFVQELTTLTTLGPTGRDSRGRGWEKGTADVFFRAARLSLDPRTPLDLGAVGDTLLPMAPTDAEWTIRDVKRKWTSQVRRARQAGAL